MISLKSPKTAVVGAWLLFLCSILYAYRVWIFSPFSILTHGDWIYFDSFSLQNYRRFFVSTWLSDFSPGRFVLDLGQGPLYALTGHLQACCKVGYALSERLIYLWPGLFLSIFLSYRFFRSIMSNPCGVVGLTVFYSLNTYFLVLQAGHITLFTAYSIFPLAYLGFFSIYRWKGVVAATLALVLIQLYEPRIFFIALGLMSGLSFITIIERVWLDRKITWILVKPLIPLLLSVLFGSFWILPVILSESTGSNELFSRGLFGEGYITLLNSLTAYHPFWSEEGLKAFIANPIPLSSFTFPFTVLLFFLGVKKKTPRDLYFVLTLLVGYLLVKQSGVPFSGSYLWLYQNVPLFNAYRESTKFIYLIVIAGTYLIARVVQESENWGKQQRFALYTVVLALVLSSYFNFMPRFLNTPRTLFAQREQPADYQNLNAFLQNEMLEENNQFKTLWIPRDSRWGTMGNGSPKLSLERLIQGEWSSLSTIRAENNPRFVQQFLALPNIRRVLDVWGVRYVVVPLQDSANDDDFYVYYGDQDSFIRSVESKRFLAPVELDLEDVRLFQNVSAYPLVFSYPNSSLMTSEMAYTPVRYQRESSTEYNLEFTHSPSGEKSYVYFQETYHPGWKIVNKSSLTYLDKFLFPLIFTHDEVIHSQQSDSNMSFFDIPEQWEEGTLYFLPQTYLYWGLFITSLTISATVLVLVMMIKPKRAAHVQ